MTISSDRRWLIVAALAIAASTLTANARAEPSAAELQNARTLFKQGESLRAAGDLRGALTALRGAHDLAHTPITGVELGAVYEQLGRLVEARDVLREVTGMPETPNESASTRRARAEVSARRGPLEARIPSVELVLDGAVKAVSIDGASVPLANLKERVSLDPGVHTVTASGDGQATRVVRLELAEGVVTHVVLDLSAPPAVAEGTAVPARIGPAPADARPAPPGRALLWTGLGVTGVGLAVGGITGILALSKKSDVDAACPNKQCPASAQSDIDASKSFGTVSTIAFVVAGAGAALAIVSFVVQRPSSRASGANARWATFTARGWEGTF